MVEFRAFRINTGGYPPNRVEAYYRDGTVESMRCLDVSIPDEPVPVSWAMDKEHHAILEQYAQDVYNNQQAQHIKVLA